MDQTKIYAQQLVAEVLSQMRNTEVDSLPVYDKGQFIGKITYDELMLFLNNEDKAGSVYAHKLNFDIGTALRAIKRINTEAYRKTSKRKSLTRQIFVGLSTIAAVTLLLLGISWMFLKPDLLTFESKDEFAAIDPDKITLTLTNGQSVVLDETKSGLRINDTGLSYNDGSRLVDQDAESISEGQSSYVKRIGHVADNKQMILRVPRKGIYEVSLPDGSKVWLNSSSILKFPATFEGTSKRRVELIGEGYFEIAKVMLKSQGKVNDKQRMPFIVVTDKQEVEVLGTQFNVSAYRDEKSVRTTLVEGSVRVKPFVHRDQLLSAIDPASLDPMQVEGGKKDIENAIVLKPNQEAQLSGTDITVKNVDAEEAFAWKNGEYIFRNTPLESIMRMLARWYDIEVVYQNKNLGSTLLGGAVSKSAKIQDVLKTLELTANVHFKIEGKKITVIE